MAIITTSEWEVMRVLWTKDTVTSSNIIEVLNGKLGWSDSTVKTLLRRLVDKGLVSSIRKGRAYYYRAECSEQEAYLDELKEVFQRICVTEHSRLLAALIEEVPMTMADMQSFQKLLLAKESTLVEEVKCDCTVGQCRCHKH